MKKEILVDNEVEMIVDHNSPSHLTSSAGGGDAPIMHSESGPGADVESDTPDHDSFELPPYSGQRMEKVLKLSQAKMVELTSSLDAFPIHGSRLNNDDQPIPSVKQWEEALHSSKLRRPDFREPLGDRDANGRRISVSATLSPAAQLESVLLSPMISPFGHASSLERPSVSSRAMSTPTLSRSQSSSQLQQKGQSLQSQFRSSKSIFTPLDLTKTKSASRPPRKEDFIHSPDPPSLPLPPLSLPTFLHLELSSEERPSQLYMHRPASSHFPYEPSHVKIERLLNFLLLPPLLEQVLWFGAVACLDAWLYTFTILPLRFLKALSILGRSWLRNVRKEAGYLAEFVYSGSGRLWRRRRRRRHSTESEIPKPIGPINSNAEPSKRLHKNETDVSTSFGLENSSTAHSQSNLNRRRIANMNSKHRRTKSIPSELMPSEKADILKGLLIILSCWILMYFDASMMYHSIRGQAAIKLYVIYNVLEVCHVERD